MSIESRAWMRALELTTPIPNQRERTLPAVIQEVAARMGNAPALLSEQECLSYSDLAAQANRWARWALEQNLGKSDVVCLLMPNQPAYMATWLGLTSVGVVVALLNTNLAGASLAHSIRVVSPRHLLVDSTCVEALASALRCLDRRPAISVYGDHGYGDHGSEELADTVLLDLTRYSAEPLLMGELDEQHTVTIEDLALYIYTSGTTGLPKAAKISHARLMQWSHWFAGMMDVAPSDRMYNCLPMHHSVGGVQAPGAMLVSGASVVIREKFSASAFWEDIRRSKCTHFQYIGELCRYLLHTPPSAQDANHRVRLACGNGLAPEVWDAFKERFQIPRILEFYAATEGNLSLFNLPGRSGAIGHIPPYLAHRFSPPLVLHDPETGEPTRAESGLCIKAAAGQTGEALGRMVDDPSGIGSRFDGYSSEEATEAKILRDAFAAGDQWFRTGDLMRRDEQGFFYFVDRAGDTFRRKGENVATSEVAAALCTFPGVRHANVYGVAVAGVDGRVGMATLVAEHDLDLAQLWDYLAGSLPRYARPVFLRMRSEAEVTGTWKYRKADLVREGYDLRVISDPLYVDVPAASAFIRLDTNLYDQVQAGSIRF